MPAFYARVTEFKPWIKTVATGSQDSDCDLWEETFKILIPNIGSIIWQHYQFLNIEIDFFQIVTLIFVFQPRQ